MDCLKCRQQFAPGCSFIFLCSHYTKSTNVVLYFFGVRYCPFCMCQQT